MFSFIGKLFGIVLGLFVLWNFFLFCVMIGMSMVFFPHADPFTVGIVALFILTILNN